MRKWLARLRCHGTLLCCQYVDLPTCNSEFETHPRAQVAYLWKTKDSTRMDFH